MTKKTALYDFHVQLGAKMSPFAGYEMPIRYSGDKEEHFLVRQKVGIFDVSHMGEFFFTGKQALPFLQAITTNDVSKLTDGKAQYSTLPNKNGGLVDDIIVYKLGEENYMMVVNAANIDKDWNWIVEQNKNFNADIQNRSEEFSLLAVSGPYALQTMQKLTSSDLGALAYYEFTNCTLAGFDNIRVATTGYTGEWTFEVFCSDNQALPLLQAILQAGEEFGIAMAGLGARDTLRLEMGYMLYGNDINDETSPLEAGLNWICKLNKGTFNSSDIFNAQKTNGVQKKLVAFEMVEKGGIPRHDYEIAYEGKVIGKVTSGSVSPCLEKGIGMGYVETAFANDGQEIDILMRGKAVKAKIVKTPFVKDTSISKKLKG